MVCKWVLSSTNINQQESKTLAHACFDTPGISFFPKVNSLLVGMVSALEAPEGCQHYVDLAEIPWDVQKSVSKDWIAELAYW